VFGVGGARQPFAADGASELRTRLRELRAGRRSLSGALLKTVSRRQLVAMDFFRGVAEMADALAERRRCRLPADFVLHVNELTLAIQNAGAASAPYHPTTSFEPLEPGPRPSGSERRRGASPAPGGAPSLVERLIARLHRH
jgi:hypothetical protein